MLDVARAERIQGSPSTYAADAMRIL